MYNRMCYNNTFLMLSNIKLFGLNCVISVSTSREDANQTYIFSYLGWLMVIYSKVLKFILYSLLDYKFIWHGGDHL